MIKMKALNQHINILAFLRQWVVVWLFLFLVAKPAVMIFSLLTETKTEYVEMQKGENNEEEKNDLYDDEKLESLFHFKAFIFRAPSLTYFDLNECIISFKPDIYIPPPQSQFY